jgi:hypothetical protein
LAAIAIDPELQAYVILFTPMRFRKIRSANKGKQELAIWQADPKGVEAYAILETQNTLPT